jgi:hypothetical protein
MLFNIRKVMVNNNGNNESFGQKINGASWVNPTLW